MQINNNSYFMEVYYKFNKYFKIDIAFTTNLKNCIF